MFQIWDSCSDAAISFGQQNLDDNLTYIVENDLVQESLMKEVAQCANVQVVYDSKVTDYKFPRELGDKATVTLEDGSIKSAGLVIGADGHNSGLRKAMNAQYFSYDYKQMGVVATLQISEVLLLNN